jgi:hypothetical protein
LPRLNKLRSNPLLRACRYLQTRRKQRQRRSLRPKLHLGPSPLRARSNLQPQRMQRQSLLLRPKLRLARLLPARRNQPKPCSRPQRHRPCAEPFRRSGQTFAVI